MQQMTKTELLEKHIKEMQRRYDVGTFSVHPLEVIKMLKQVLECQK